MPLIFIYWQSKIDFLTHVIIIPIFTTFLGDSPYEEGKELAIKIFKTTLNEFRDREQYIAGKS